MDKRARMMIERSSIRERGMRALFRLFFGRTMVTMLLLVAQIVIIFLVFNRLSQYAEWILSIFTVISALIILYIINCKENPAFKLAWMIPMCLFPVFGTLLFMFVQGNPGSRGLQKKLDRRKRETADYGITSDRVMEKMEKENSPVRGLAHYIQNSNGYAAFDGAEVSYFPLGEDKYQDMLVELKKAEKYIFMEYFIIDRGIMWQSILDILVEKASEGVEVRVMYDGMCSLVKLPYNYARELEKVGLKARVFSPIKPMLSTHQNNRDHRKILIIDGKVCYSGGINLADEYINQISPYGHWKDVSVKIRGDAVRSYLIMFLQMWNLNETGEESYEKYINDPDIVSLSNASGYVIPYCDDPTNREDVAENVYLHIIDSAVKYVYIMTPYLILDNEHVVALTFAAKRGVDVRIILPHIPDKKLAFYIARTYYPQLIGEGVKIYEYMPGFMHAKVFVSDDDKAVVGSVNLDFRSLYEHFECATFLYCNSAISDIRKDYDKTVEQSRQITLEDYKHFSFISRALGRIFRVFGPLM